MKDLLLYCRAAPRPLLLLRPVRHLRLPGGVLGAPRRPPYKPKRSDRLGSLMLGKVKRGRGCLCGGGDWGGRAPVGGVKNGAPPEEKPGRRGTRGGGGGLGGGGREGGAPLWGGGGWGRPPCVGGRGAVRVPSPVCTRLATGTGEVRAKLHWVLQMLSLRTASTPTSAISWRQLLTRRDWHSAWRGGEMRYSEMEDVCLRSPWCRCRRCRVRSSCWPPGGCRSHPLCTCAPG